jgi:hypothetical protein
VEGLHGLTIAAESFRTALGVVGVSGRRHLSEVETMVAVPLNLQAAAMVLGLPHGQYMSRSAAHSLVTHIMTSVDTFVFEASQYAIYLENGDAASASITKESLVQAAKIIPAMEASRQNGGVDTPTFKWGVLDALKMTVGDALLHEGSVDRHILVGGSSVPAAMIMQNVSAGLTTSSSVPAVPSTITAAVGHLYNRIDDVADTSLSNTPLYDFLQLRGGRASVLNVDGVSSYGVRRATPVAGSEDPVSGFPTSFTLSSTKISDACFINLGLFSDKAGGREDSRNKPIIPATSSDAMSVTVRTRTVFRYLTQATNFSNANNFAQLNTCDLTFDKVTVMVLATYPVDNFITYGSGNSGSPDDTQNLGIAEVIGRVIKKVVVRGLTAPEVDMRCDDTSEITFNVLPGYCYTLVIFPALNDMFAVSWDPEGLQASLPTTTGSCVGKYISGATTSLSMMNNASVGSISRTTRLIDLVGMDSSPERSLLTVSSLGERFATIYQAEFNELFSGLLISAKLRTEFKQLAISIADGAGVTGTDTTKASFGYGAVADIGSWWKTKSLSGKGELLIRLLEQVPGGRHRPAVDVKPAARQPKVTIRPAFATLQ